MPKTGKRKRYSVVDHGYSSGYAVIPRIFVTYREISNDAKVLYLLLSIRPGSTLYQLSALMDCSQRSISRWLRELREFGAIEGEYK